MTLIYLIRHGETDWNLNGRWQGQINIPLNETGRQQASLLAAHLRHYRGLFGRLYSSDLGRAWDTAAIIGEALGQPPVALPGWRELDVGCWGGLTKAEQIVDVRIEYPTDFAAQQLRYSAKYAFLPPNP